MKLVWTSALLLCAALPLAAPLAAQTPSTPATKEEGKQPKVLKVGSTVPESIYLPSFEGLDTSFKDLRGKVVILHFWSDRCPAERHANPVFKQMEGKYKASKEVVIIGIASNQNELGVKPAKGADYSKHYVKLREKAKKAGFEHRILVDHGNKVSALFGARSTPHCFVIDKRGVLQYSGALDNDPRGKRGKEATNYLVNATAALLAGNKPEVTSTKPYG
ncbi:MAG: thiol-disulfide isomerase/thioredoxin [Candidatus Paceibacteria bacterium]|jgi:thiol-disulfide isomerase/thioredoxin